VAWWWLLLASLGVTSCRCCPACILDRAWCGTLVRPRLVLLFGDTGGRCSLGHAVPFGLRLRFLLRSVRACFLKLSGCGLGSAMPFDFACGVVS
jgi:hypothetical protein